LTLATAEEWGTYYPFGKAYSRLISRHQPNIEIAVVETGGSQENMQLLNARKVDLAVCQGNIQATPSVRSIASLFPEILHIMSSKTADIRELVDIKGKRVAHLLSEKSGSYALFNRIVERYGIKATEIDLVEVSADKINHAFDTGFVDAAYHVLALGNAKIHSILNSTQASLISVERGLALETLLPYIDATIIPKGAYGGEPSNPEKDIPAVAVRAQLLAHKDVDQRIVNAMTQVLFDYRNELVMDYPLDSAIVHPEGGQALNAPLHPGARAYYDKNKPSFLVQYAEVIALLLSVTILAVSALWQLRYYYMQRQKNRADMYNNEILNLADKIRRENSLSRLHELQEELYGIFRRVIHDYDVDKITFESFQSLIFPWETAVGEARHREMLAKLASSTSDSTSMDE